MWHFDCTYQPGEHEGKPGVWYELTKATQHQLLECMADWGHFLEYDEGHDMFFAPEKRNEQAVPGEAAGADWYETLVRAPTRSKESTKEVLAVAKTIFTIRTLYRTHGGGTTPASPAFCDHARNSHSGSSEECEWTAPFCREFNKRPIIDTDGPIFVEHARYHCSRHNSYASDEPTKPGDNNIPHHKLKDMRYTTEFILTVQSIYVDTLSVAATRRRILDQWTAKALGKIGNLKEAQLKYAFGTMELQRASYLLLALEARVYVTWHCALAYGHWERPEGGGGAAANDELRMNPRRHDARQ